MLRKLMRRPTFEMTPGLLSKLSGVPKGSIVNWLEGRSRGPRRAHVVGALADGLRLGDDDRAALYWAAGFAGERVLTLDHPFDRVPVGIYRTTLAGRVIFANTTLVRMLGYPDRSRYLGLDVARDLYASQRDRRIWLERIVEAGTLRRYPTSVKRADGSLLGVLDTATAVRDAAGGVLFFDGVWDPS